MRIHYQTRRHGVRPWAWKVEVLAWILWKDDSSRFILGLALCAECLLDGTNWLCTLEALTAARNVTYRYRISDEDAKNENITGLYPIFVRKSEVLSVVEHTV